MQTNPFWSGQGLRSDDRHFSIGPAAEQTLRANYLAISGSGTAS